MAIPDEGDLDSYQLRGSWRGDRAWAGEFGGIERVGIEGAGNCRAAVATLALAAAVIVAATVAEPFLTAFARAALPPG